MHLKLRALFFIAVFVLVFDYAFALSLPLPPKTKLTRQEKVEVDGKERDILAYETDLSREDVIAFYNKALERQGYAVFMQQQGMLSYRKGDQVLLIFIVAVPGEKTKIMASSGILEDKPRQSVCENIPGVPVYPGATCLGSIKAKGQNMLSVKYSIPAAPQEALDFYRLQLPGNNWKLETDRGLESQQVKAMQEPGADTRLLAFSNYKNEKCKIIVINFPLMGKSSLVNIVYEKK